jgi:hypothetical protein
MIIHIREAFNGFLDELVRPEIHVWHRSWSTFHICACTGLTLAISLAIALGTHQGLSHWVIAGLTLSAMATFLGLVVVTKIIIGDEEITLYHHEIAVMVVAALWLGILRQPILRSLDVMILGIGTFLACGRIGCLMVGCCHGRPYPWGVSYRREHASAGFTPYYVGIRLFPIQALESLWVFGIVLVGSILVPSGRPPGTALAWYVITYGIGRFCFECMRGDPARPYFWGFSQSQWITLLLMGCVVWAELFGIMPVHQWHAEATACLVLVMIAIAVRRRFQKTAKHRLLHPRHVKEVADVVDLLSSLTTESTAIPRWTSTSRRNSIPESIHIGCTSLGVQISATKNWSTAGCTHHFALSYREGGMTEETARILVRLILQLKQTTGSSEFLTGHGDVFHLLIHPLKDLSLVHRVANA